jgi:hypothetical protein
MSDPTGAERQRRCRRRLRHAMMPCGCEIDVAVIDKLIERGLLTEDGADDRHAIGAALSKYIATSFGTRFLSQRDEKRRGVR